MSNKIRSTKFDNDSEMFEIIKYNKEGESNSVEYRKMLRILRKVVDEQLSERQKQYVMLYYYKRMKITQIAQMFGVNKSTVSRTINRARQNIKRYMQYYYF